MKLKKLKLKNFANFVDFECDFNDSITRLIGINGAGKTTIGLTAIWACLKGISEKTKGGQLLGDRFRFIGNSKVSADIELTLFDEIKNCEIKIRNHITKQTNHITFQSDDKSFTQEWLNNFLSVAFLSAKNFTQLDSKKQAILLGIDVNKIDNEIKDIKNEYTILNREYRNFGELKEIDKIEKRSITELLNQRKEIENFNNEQDKKQNEIDNYSESIRDIRNHINELNTKLIKEEAYLKSLPEAEEIKNTQKIINEIENIENINQKANDYENYINKKKAKDEKQNQLNINKEAQKKKENERLDYIKSFQFGLDNLIVNEEGELLLNNKLIKEPYFSKGEIEIIVAKLYMYTNPELKVRFIDDFELLDDKNQLNLVNSLTEKGFQIITAEVGDKIKKENSILLRECKIIDEYKKENKII